jgi:hypothetical protein
MISIEEKKIVLELAKKYRESALTINEINNKIASLKEIVDKETSSLLLIRETEKEFVSNLTSKYNITESKLIQELQKIMMTDG